MNNVTSRKCSRCGSTVPRPTPPLQHPGTELESEDQPPRSRQADEAILKRLYALEVQAAANALGHAKIRGGDISDYEVGEAWNKLKDLKHLGWRGAAAAGPDAEVPQNNKPDPDELAELRARLHARVLKNIQIGREADERFEKTGDKGGLGAVLEKQQMHIKALQRRVGDLEALMTALLVIIDPIRIVNPNHRRLRRYMNDDCGGSCVQEQLQLTDLGNVPRGGDIAAHDFLVAVVHQPYYSLLNGHRAIAPGTPPEGELPVYQDGG
jgi:hypothetical protein